MTSQQTNKEGLYDTLIGIWLLGTMVGTVVGIVAMVLNVTSVGLAIGIPSVISFALIMFLRGRN